MKLQYDYSTKNFHRFATGAGNGLAPKEIYVARSAMPQPVAEVNVEVTIANPAVVAEKVKPARA